MTETFLWHDYETFGANPAADRPAQFAAIRTNTQLKEEGEPLVWYCQPANDMLPHPQACLITGITPQHAFKHGIPEAEFAQHIRDEMMEPGTCVVGYNNIRFDDEVTRHLFYRNFYDAYEREYKNGNSRWDLIDLARMTYALRPEGIQWPGREDGSPSFRLEDLSKANNIAHEDAHDALSDVRATIAMAKLIRQHHPRLFDWSLGLRNQKTARSLLDHKQPQPVLHTTSRIPASRGCTSLVLPLAVQPDRPKSIIVFDLMADPQPLINETAEDIYDRVFTATDDLPEGLDRIPLKAIHTNKVPMIAPIAVVKTIDCERIGLDVQRCLDHADQIKAQLQSIQFKLMEVFQPPESSQLGDPDLMLYSGGFFSPGDRQLMNQVHAMEPAAIPEKNWHFRDPRLNTMLFRYRARNYPHTLTPQEQVQWEQERAHRLLRPSDDRILGRSRFVDLLGQMRQEHQGEQRILLDQLEAWMMESGIADLRLPSEDLNE